MESEFRKDIVTGDWVLIAAERGKRPHAPKPRTENYQTPQECPFEGVKKALEVLPNKYPAVTPGVCGPVMEHQGYDVAAGVGTHQLIVMRDHEKQLHDFSSDAMREVISAYRTSYRDIARSDDCAQYIMIFNNYGPEGGASIYHPHSQIISVPVMPPSVMRSIRGSHAYFKKHGTEAHAVMIEREKTAGTRIIFENERFIAFCPFVSKQPYEIRIYPKFASAYFDRIEDDDMLPLSEALTTVLKKMHTTLHDPAYNFFIHTAPLRFEEDVTWDVCYRWHIEVIPRVSFDAGFEAGTGIKINAVDPDIAAQELQA